ncbi:MAG: M56 family metallopeptidase [Candidatus Fimenecus sp.]
MSFTASFLMLAVFLLRFCLQKAPKWVTCLLWALVAVRLAFPFSIKSEVSLVPNTADASEAIVLTAQEKGYALSAAEPLGGSAVGILFAVWATGMVAMLLYAVCSYLRLYLQLRISVHESGKIWLCDGLQTPFVFGVFQPRIYLPSVMQAPQKAYVLRHEFAHLSRGDQIWKPLGFLLLSIYWFHPLVWVSYFLFCRDMELACDERVVRKMPSAEKKAYAETLLLCSVRNRRIAACPLSFAEVGVKTRIKFVLRYKKPLVSVVVLSCIAVAAAAVCFLTESKPVEVYLVKSAAVQIDFTKTDPEIPTAAEDVTLHGTEPVTETVTNR